MKGSETCDTVANSWAVNGSHCFTADQIILQKKQAEHAIQEALLLHAPWSFKQLTLLCWLVSLTPPDTQKKTYPIIGISENHRLKVAF